jgi:hypothetical protein
MWAFKDKIFQDHIYKAAQEFFQIDDPSKNIDLDKSSQINASLLADSIKYLGGVCPTESLPHFKRLLMRATRFHVYIYHKILDVDICNRIIGDTYHAGKTVFVLAY